MLLSGCDGVHDNMEFWANRLAARGYRALILDSHRPRGLDRFEAWRLVCAGQVLPGAERAGDLAVALADPALPAGGRIVLGASHGGWAAMEFLRLALTALFSIVMIKASFDLALLTSGQLTAALQISASWAYAACAVGFAGLTIVSLSAMLTRMPAE